jgi:hypothetical protein
LSIVLKNVTIVDVVFKKIREKTTVFVLGNKIDRISDTADGNDINSDSEVIDCENRFLIPGMVDAHVHLDYFHSPSTDGSRTLGVTKEDVRSKLISRLHSYLYCGVTSIYDAGNDPDIIFPLRRSEREGKIISPRIHCTGSLITCKDGHNGFSHTTYISSMPEDEQKIQDQISCNPDIVKITYDEHNWGTRSLIPILRMDTLRQIVDYCHSRKFLVTIHTSNEIRSREAIACGVDSLARPVMQSPGTEEFVW